MGYRRIKERRSAIASKPTKAPFGWSDIIGGMKKGERKTGEKILFFLVWFKRENTKNRNQREKKKYTWAHKFLSS